jgi:hypothetical protein
MVFSPKCRREIRMESKKIKKEKSWGLGGSPHLAPEAGSALSLAGLGLALIAW